MTAAIGVKTGASGEVTAATTAVTTAATGADRELQNKQRPEETPGVFAFYDFLRCRRGDGDLRSPQHPCRHMQR